MPQSRSLDDPDILRLIARSLRQGLYITTERGEFLDANPAFLELMGVGSLEELQRYTAPDLVIDGRQREAEMELLRRDGEVHEYELGIIRPDGEMRTVLDTTFTMRDPGTGETFFHGILVDITRRKELEVELRDLSTRDPLTGCFNRRYLDEITSTMADRLVRTWGCVYIDIDHFKQYNDAHGHQAGDEVLVQISRFLMRSVRAREAIVRLGGDEFLVVLESAELASTERVARRLQLDAIGSASVPFSLGWAARENDESLEQTIHRADKKLLAVRVIDRTEERAHRRTGELV